MAFFVKMETKKRMRKKEDLNVSVLNSKEFEEWLEDNYPGRYNFGEFRKGNSIVSKDQMTRIVKV